ncbi:MAG: ATP-binding protein, partial [Acidobacteriota bacterium]
WWAAVLFGVLPESSSLGVNLLGDVLYVLFYLVCLLAADQLPGGARGPGSTDRRRLHSAGQILMVFGLLVYFVVIPARVDETLYDTWLPSFYLYVVLDLLVAGRFGVLCFRVEDTTWRWICGTLAISWLGWGILDALDAAWRVEFLGLTVPPWFNTVFHLPKLGVAAAAVLGRSSPRGSEPDRPVPEAVEGDAPLPPELIQGSGGRSSFLVLATALFPVLHIGLYQAEVLETVTRDPREAWVMIVLLLLGGMAMAEHRGLRQRAERAAWARREAYRELDEARRVAERASLAKGEFLANMSHEIRTPLNGVVGLTGLILSKELPAEARRYAEMLKTSGDGLLHIVDEILDFSKIEAGQLELEAIPFDLRVSVRKVLAVQRESAAAKGLQLGLELDDDVPTLLVGDPVRLRQVLLNLVANAVKFTADGRIQVRIQKGTPSSAASEDAAWLRFEVEDTGIGIPRRQRERLFSPFTQADTSSSRTYGGTGLGLAICRQLVEAMGGRIGVTSEPAVGSTFWFDAPFEVAEPDDVETLELTSGIYDQEARRRFRILLAEDNPINQLVTLEQLEGLGYQADLAQDGREALTAIESRHYDLVLMDCQMPGIDGYEATRLLRRRERGSGRRLPVVALTAHARKEDYETCLAAGMDDYLSKPYAEETLAAILRRWVSDAQDPETSADETS